MRFKVSPALPVLGKVIAAALLLSPAFALADSGSDGMRNIQPDEYGLEHAFRVSIGGYKYHFTDLETQAEVKDSGVKTDGFALKIDQSFFRPTRHEALVSLNYLNRPESGTGSILLPSVEYRWRFGGEGRGYYGINIGEGFAIGNGASGNALFTGSALGYEFPHRVFAEFRYSYDNSDRFEVSQFMVGVRL